MSKPSWVSYDLIQLGFHRKGGDSWLYMQADWGNGMTALLECSEGGIWRCKVSAPGDGWKGRVACGKSRDPVEAVRSAARLSGLAYIEAARNLEDRQKSLRARLATLTEVKEKLDIALTKGK